jgi:hypothetical protein
MPVFFYGTTQLAFLPRAVAGDIRIGKTAQIAEVLCAGNKLVLAQTTVVIQDDISKVQNPSMTAWPLSIKPGRIAATSKTRRTLSRQIGGANGCWRTRFRTG